MVSAISGIGFRDTRVCSGFLRVYRTVKRNCAASAFEFRSEFPHLSRLLTACSVSNVLKCHVYSIPPMRSERVGALSVFFPACRSVMLLSSQLAYDFSNVTEIFASPEGMTPPSGKRREVQKGRVTTYSSVQRKLARPGDRNVKQRKGYAPLEMQTVWIMDVGNTPRFEFYQVRL